MAELEHLVHVNKAPVVQTPEELREFLNEGAIYDLDYRLKLLNGGEPEKPFSIFEEDREFTVSWIYKARKRLLVVQNSLARLPGLFLNLPVELDEYKVAPGEINASFTPLNKERRVPEPYTEGMAIIGSPLAVVKIMIVAGSELSVASGIVSAEDI